MILDSLSVYNYVPSLKTMKSIHVLLFGILTGIWIWSLPILCVAAFFMMPMAMLTLFVLVVVGSYLQYTSDGRPIHDHWIRKYVSNIPWYEWFPCNQLTIDSGLIAVHPHGILCCGTLAGIHFVKGSKTCMCIAPIVFYIPVIGILARYLGCIPATRLSMLTALRKGLPVIVVPGGVPEIVLAETGDDTRRFKRYGFLKIARDVRCKLSMVFVRGECSLYRLCRGPFLEWRAWISWRLNIPFVMPIMLGWYGTWLPKRSKLTLVSSSCSAGHRDCYEEEFEKLVCRATK